MQADQLTGDADPVQFLLIRPVSKCHKRRNRDGFVAAPAQTQLDMMSRFITSTSDRTGYAGYLAITQSTESILSYNKNQDVEKNNS